MFEYLRSIVGRRNITSMMKGTAITRITLNQIKSVKIPATEIGYQSEIIDKFETINSAIRISESRNSSARIMKTTLIREFEGKNNVQ